MLHMTPKEQLIESLRELCKHEGGHIVVAEEIQANDQTIWQIVNGVKLPSGAPRGVGPSLQKKLDARYPGWALLRAGNDSSIVLSGEALPPDGYVRLEHLSPQPSMGPGSSVDEPTIIVRHLDVLEQWVRQKVGSTNPERIKILTGCGQSMSPTILDQDLVFVDIGQKTIDIPGIYVIDVYGRFLLKRVLIQSTGTLILRSDNTEEFPDEERIDLRKAAETIHIAGRVKAWWTLRQG